MDTEAARLTDLGLAARAEGRFVEALAYQRQAHALAPDNWGVLVNLGAVLQDVGALGEATASFLRAGQLSSHPLPIANLGMAWLRGGFLQQGFRAFLARWRAAGWPQQPYGLPCPHVLPSLSALPTRELIENKQPLVLPPGRLLLLPDQGFGDTLLTLPFIRSLLRVRPDVSVMMKPPLLSLARAALGDLTDQIHHTAQGPFSGWLTGFDVPAFLPGALEGYAKERQAAEVRLRTAFLSVPLHDSISVSVVWRGNPGHVLDRWRRAGPEVLGEILQGMPCEPIGLLPDISDGESEAFSQKAGKPLHRPLLQDFAGSAQVLLTCSALVSVDTAAVHLAGLLGVPAFLLVYASGDWRWGQKGETASWYPSVKLLRQIKPMDWSEAVCLIRPRLAALLEKNDGLLQQYQP